MAGPKCLNPQALEYFPLSYETPYPDNYVSLMSQGFSHSIPDFYYASPSVPPPPYLATPPQSPFFSQALNTRSYTLPLPVPPPPAVVKPSPEQFQVGGGQEAITQRVRHREFGKRKDRFGHRHQLHKEVQARGKLDKHQVLPLKHSEGKTTVMIKNIPKEYDRELLMKFIDEHCMLENQRKEDAAVSAYDFLYLPIDFGSGCNKGYAFVNFTNPRAVWRFYRACNKQTWDFFQSPKIREIVCAMIQGKEALVKHFSESTFRCGMEEFLPVCFSPARDGSGDLVTERTVGRRVDTRSPRL